MSKNNQIIQSRGQKSTRRRKIQKKPDRIYMPDPKTGFFPPRCITFLHYADMFTLSGATLSAAFGSEYSFRLNSIYDPDFTGTGHQPYMFDQITPFYNRYLVKSANVEIKFSDPQGDGCYVGVYLKNFTDTSTLANSTISAAMEKPTVFLKPLNNTGSQVVTYRKNIQMHELAGLTKQQYENNYSHTGALVNQNPNQVPYLSFAVADANASSPALTCRVTISIDYCVEFFERILSAAQS